MPEKFAFFKSYWETAQRLSEAERLAWYDGLLGYAFEGVDPKLPPPLDLVWINVRPVVDKSVEASANGAKGGRPRKKKEPLEEGLKGGFLQGAETLSNRNRKVKGKVKGQYARPGARATATFHACPDCGARLSKLFDREGHPWLCPECGILSGEPEVKEAAQ